MQIEFTIKFALTPLFKLEERGFNNVLFCLFFYYLYFGLLKTGWG